MEDSYTISNTVAHEIGHAFGLSHNLGYLGYMMDDGGCGNNSLWE